MTRTIADPIPPALCSTLGISDDDDLTEIAREATPDLPVAHGLSTGVDSVETLIERFKQDPSRTPLHPSITEGLPEDIDIVRWATHPEMVALRGAIEGATFVGEILRVADDEVLIRPGVEGAAAMFDLGRVLIFTPTEVRLCARAESSPVRAPDVRALADELTAPPWLIESAELLARSRLPVSRAAAVGLIARLWTPAIAQDLPAAEGVTDTWRRTPRSRAVAWFRAVPEGARAAIVRDAAAEIAVLSERLAALTSLAAEGSPTADNAALAWIHRRDDLASVSVLARTTGQAADLDEALASLDLTTAMHHSVWAAIPGLSDDPRIKAVSWQEPEHWWGTLALP